MKKSSAVLLLLCTGFLICSCASKQPVVIQPPKYGYEEDAISLHLKGDSRLNLYDRTSHTLFLCLYQLSDPNAFNQLKDDKDGLTKLLECSRFDPSVASAKKLVIQPGQDLKVSLDRAEGAKYVALVCGYYLLEKERVVRLFKVPVLEDKKTKTATLGTLFIELYLGPHEIQEFEEE